MKTLQKLIVYGLTAMGVMMVARSGFDTMRSGSRYFGAARKIDFNDPSTLDNAQREVRSGPLRVMGGAAKTVYHASTVAIPSDELTIGIAVGQDGLERAEVALQKMKKKKRDEALAALKQAKAESAEEGPSKPRTETSLNTRSSAIPSNSIVGTWNGSISEPATNNPKREVVKPLELKARSLGGADFACIMRIKNDKDAPIETIRITHTGNNRYVGKFNRNYVIEDLDLKSFVNGVLDLQVSGNLIKGTMFMKTKELRRGKTIHYENNLSIELIR